MVIIDPNREHIAKREANRLRIPVVALADSNCDPDGIDFLIPGNDDALRSIRLVTTFLVLAVEEGMNRRQQAIRREVEEESAKRGSARSEERQIGARGKAYVAEKPVKPGSNRKTAGGIIS